MSDLQKTIQQAVQEGLLLESSADNIFRLLGSGDNPIYRSSVKELVDAEAWAELNDRFFRTLAFGTGGLAGRSFGRVGTGAGERGETSARCPAQPYSRYQAQKFFKVVKAHPHVCPY